MLRRLIGGRASCIAASRSSSIGDNIVLTFAATASYATVVFADEMTRPLYMSANSTAPLSKSFLQIIFEAILLHHPQMHRRWSQLSLRNSLMIHFARSKMNLCLRYSTLQQFGVAPEGLGNALSKLNIHSVPTLDFFQNGKKAGEVIGADVQLLKDKMEELYK